MYDEPRRPPIWVTGALLGCVGTGCVGVMRAIRDLRTLWGAVDVPQMQGAEAWWTDVARAHNDISVAHARVELPFALANVLLSTVLLFAAWRTLSGAPGARRFASQAVLANALLSVVAFVATAEARNKMAMAFADHMPRWTKATGEAVGWEEIAATIRFLQRSALAFAMSVYGVLLLALGSEAAKATLPDDESDDEAV